ncbi:MAG: response regulator [Saprospiraceae bacterium]|jgi:predicted outer membrane repeat protein|nr:response regulator [Saprospiraceae bacterium]
MKPISILIYDDDNNYRDSLSRYVAATDGLNLVGAFSDCRNVAQHVEILKPDLVLMDIDMPYVNGLEGTTIVKSKFPEVKVVILTVFDDDEKIFRAMSIGPDGYLLKMNTSLEKLTGSIHEVMAGGANMSPYIARRMIDFFKSSPPTAGAEVDLSDKEIEVLRWLSKGYSYKMVASEIGISINTVKFHLKKIYKKLQVQSAPEAVAKAILERFVSVVLALAVALFPLHLHARVWHVKADAGGANSGLNWADAFPDLQDGLRAARAGDEVWVARGVYAPTKTDNRDISFELISGVGLYGAFGGWEEHLEQRNPIWYGDNRTTLTGKIGGGANAYHILCAQNVENVVVDGFFIVDGNANGQKRPRDFGGALYFESVGAFNTASIRLTHCLFQGNKSENTGGALCFQAMGGGKIEIYLNETSFWGNNGSEGGAITCFTGHGSCSLEIHNSEFHNNAAQIGNYGPSIGGAIYFVSNFSQNDRLTIKNCTFENNRAKNGGAVHVFRLRRAGFIIEMTDCRFNNNHATDHGGAVSIQLNAADHIKKQSVVDIKNCLFAGNRSGGLGGAICQLSDPLTGVATNLQHCTFTGNKALSGGTIARTDWINSGQTIKAAGGAIAALFLNEPDSLTTFWVTQCRFADNETDGAGGAFYMESDQTDPVPVSFYDVIFDANKAKTGDAIYLNSMHKPLILNGCLLKENNKTQIEGAVGLVHLIDQPFPEIRLNEPGRWVTDENGNRIFHTFGN